jgi:hypothetical protein
MQESHEVSTPDRRYMLLGLRIVVEFGAAIAVPVVALALVGKRLDLACGTWPLFTSLGFVLAALITAFSVRRRARRFGQEYQKLIDSEKPSS